MISDVNFVTAQIKMYKENIPVGSASGFFFKKEDKKYYVTNRHVVISEKDDYFPDKIKLRLHYSKTDMKINQYLEIPLYDDSDNKVWHEHPNYDDIRCDIVVIPLNNNTLQAHGMRVFNSASITFLDSKLINVAEVNPFGNLAVVGYPLGFYDQINNLPVYRKAMIASQYGVNFNGKPYFLVDTNLHPGTSGSPVLNTQHTLFKQKGSKEGYALFGIHSAEHIMAGEPLGLNVVWYSYLINEIVDNLIIEVQ